MHRSVLQNRKYIKYSAANAVEVISMEEIDVSFDIEELITEEMMVVTFSRGGYVKRVALETYRAEGRGGRGVRGTDSKEGDVLKSIFVALTRSAAAVSRSPRASRRLESERCTFDQ